MKQTNKRTVLLLSWLIGCLLAAGNLPARAQGRYADARDLVARTQEDLRRTMGFVREKKDQRERIDNAQKHLSEFDRQLTRNKFDKDKLNDAIDDVKNVVEHNTLAGEDRDALMRDLEDLRRMREAKGRY